MGPVHPSRGLPYLWQPQAPAELGIGLSAPRAKCPPNPHQASPRERGLAFGAHHQAQERPRTDKASGGTEQTWPKGHLLPWPRPWGTALKPVSLPSGRHPHLGGPTPVLLRDVQQTSTGHSRSLEARAGPIQPSQAQ